MPSQTSLTEKWLDYIRSECCDGTFGAMDDWHWMLTNMPDHPMIPLVNTLIRHGLVPPEREPEI
jgi:hypothetical protein